jgi:cytochrome c2
MVRNLILGIFFCFYALADETFVFKKQGKEVAKYNLQSFVKLFTPTKVTVNEGHENTINTYEGVRLIDVFQKVYGGTWSAEKNSLGVDEALFSCKDGYQPSVPLFKALKHDTYLVWARADGAPFRFKDTAKNQWTDYGPLYLVWENINDPITKKETIELWPYQVNEIDLIRFADKFSAIVPEGNMTPQAKRGFVAYRAHCIQCHTINGQGGKKGIELNFPVSVVEYIKEPWIKKYILDPRSVRHGATMPAFKEIFNDGEKTVTEIVAYLKAVSANKKQP